jgi:hypothetical protein
VELQAVDEMGSEYVLPFESEDTQNLLYIQAID